MTFFFFLNHLTSTARFEGFSKRQLLLTKKDMTTQFRFAKVHLNKLQAFWKNDLWTDETKLEMSAQHHVWEKPNAANQ